MLKWLQAEMMKYFIDNKTVVNRPFFILGNYIKVLHILDISVKIFIYNCNLIKMFPASKAGGIRLIFSAGVKSSAESVE